METKYSVEVSFTPLCTSCGKELKVGGTYTESRDFKEFDMKDRKVFVCACEHCFVFKGDIDRNFKIEG